MVMARAVMAHVAPVMMRLMRAPAIVLEMSMRIVGISMMMILLRNTIMRVRVIFLRYVLTQALSEKIYWSFNGIKI